MKELSGTSILQSCSGTGSDLLTLCIHFPRKSILGEAPAWNQVRRNSLLQSFLKWCGHGSSLIQLLLVPFSWWFWWLHCTFPFSAVSEFCTVERCWINNSGGQGPVILWDDENVMSLFLLTSECMAHSGFRYWSDTRIGRFY